MWESADSVSTVGWWKGLCSGEAKMSVASTVRYRHCQLLNKTGVGTNIHSWKRNRLSTAHAQKLFCISHSLKFVKAEQNRTRLHNKKTNSSPANSMHELNFTMTITQNVTLLGRPVSLSSTRITLRSAQILQNTQTENKPSKPRNCVQAQRVLGHEMQWLCVNCKMQITESSNQITTFGSLFICCSRVFKFPKITDYQRKLWINKDSSKSVSSHKNVLENFPDIFCKFKFSTVANRSMLPHSMDHCNCCRHASSTNTKC